MKKKNQKTSTSTYDENLKLKIQKSLFYPKKFLTNPTKNLHIVLNGKCETYSSHKTMMPTIITYVQHCKSRSAFQTKKLKTGRKQKLSSLRKYKKIRNI